MSSSSAPRCRHIKVNGTQCGSPALRNKNFCFYHQQNRPVTVDCYYNPEEYATGEIVLPVFEDAHSIQTVIRQVVQMVLQKRLERKTASVLLYALQIASSNLKRMELEKPQPEQVVVALDTASETPMAAPAGIEDESEGKLEDKMEDLTPEETAQERSVASQTANRSPNATPVNATYQLSEDIQPSHEDENLPPGTIHACYRPGSPHLNTRTTREKPSIPASARQRFHKVPARELRER
jgi:hypothetical protein